MRTYILLLITVVLMSGCTTSTPTEQLQDLMQTYHEETLKMNPLGATYQGDTRYNNYLPNYLSDDVMRKHKAFYKDILEELSNIDDKSLSEEDQLSKEILIWECETSLMGMEFPRELLPIDQMWTLQLTIGQLATGTGAQPFKTVEDYENWLSRVDDYVVWLSSAKTRMAEGIEQGVVLPKSLIRKVVPQLASITQADLEKNIFYTPARNFPADFTEAQKEKLSKAYADMVTNKIITAYQSLLEFMGNEYLLAGRNSSGFDAYSFGEDYYNYAIRLYTTTDMTADEIHQLGLSEVARLRSEMERIKNQVGFEGDLNAFFDHVRTRKSLMPFDDPQQVIDNFNAIHDKMKAKVDALFELQPKTAFEVRRVEAFREKSAAAHYNSGSLDGTRPGVFYVPIPNVKEYNVFSDEDLFLHEAIPGHHFQISLQQENTDLPNFRKTLWYSSYGEGWALYCESLGQELGLYDDPYQYFGMLSAEMHRAIRLVVDTGLHTKGWTREQAIAYSLANEAEPEYAITSEIERYMANPGQALSYKIGQLKLRELRAMAEEALGDGFDIRAFHRVVLESGCIPLALLVNKVNDWIASEKES
ncbi:MAG: DUF885 domain-containing protein [Flavobacteriaceae bacterium]|nr:DUF885 domain-containing protein [Flavobacteriaceae bacterium]MDG2290077.1 DUF885 domain-containing protein [Flavobacteriaceae bacterium]